MIDHRHSWVLEDDWTEYDVRLNRAKHFTSYKCDGLCCTMRKVILQETTTFEYLVDMSFDV